jgi:nucleoside-diphosphate-sugar epimerase
MNFLVVGHEGYLGRSLFAYLSGRHRVWGWDKNEDIFKLDARFLAENHIDALVNLSVMADRGSKTYLVGTPTEHVNVMGARHLAEVLRGTDVAWFQISTREVLGPVYGARDVRKAKSGYRPKFLVDESYPYAPQNFYGKSKVVAEMISESHPKSNVIRLTTCYTDYDYPGGASWVLQLIRAAVEKKLVNLTRGGGLQFRDPLHIDDLGRLIEGLLKRQVFGEKIHAGGGRKNLISLGEFVKIAEPKVKIARVAGGDYGFAFDNRKALRLAGWEPRILIRDKVPVIAENIRLGVTAPPPPRSAVA